MQYFVALNSYGRDVFWVERALRSFLAQKWPPQKIFLIDQNEKPLQLASEFQNQPLLNHLHRPVRSCSVARNSLIEMVPSGWIAFCDDDAFWAPDYSEQLQMVLQQSPELQMIAGCVRDEKSGEYYSYRQKVGGRLDSFLGSKILPGANFLIRAELFREIKGYEPRLGPGTFWPSSEEPDLCWRVLLTGARMKYVRELCVFHPPTHDSDTEKASLKAYQYGRGKGALAALWLLEKKHRFGLYESLEMIVVPFVNMLRGILRGRASQIKIQWAVLRGRVKGFYEFATKQGAP